MTTKYAFIRKILFNTIIYIYSVENISQVNVLILDSIYPIIYVAIYIYNQNRMARIRNLGFQLDDSWHERSIRDTKRSASTAFSTIRGHRIHIVRADQRFSTRHAPANIPNFPRFISGFPLPHSFIINSYISIKPNRQFLINPGCEVCRCHVICLDKPFFDYH